MTTATLLVAPPSTAGTLPSMANNVDLTGPSKITLGYDPDTTPFDANQHWVEIDGVTAVDGAGSYVWNTTGLPAGTYYFNGYMYDFAVGTAVYSHLATSVAVIGGPASTFTLTGPSAGTFTAGQNVTIQWTAAKVQQLIDAGKIEVASLKVGSLETTIGRTLLYSTEEEPVRCDQTGAILDAICKQRSCIATRRVQVSEAASALERKRLDLCQAFGLDKIEGTSTLDAERHKWQAVIQEKEKERLQLEAGLPDKLLAESNMPTQGRLAEMLNDLRQTGPSRVVSWDPGGSIPKLVSTIFPEGFASHQRIWRTGAVITVIILVIVIIQLVSHTGTPDRNNDDQVSEKRSPVAHTATEDTKIERFEQRVMSAMQQAPSGSAERPLGASGGEYDRLRINGIDDGVVRAVVLHEVTCVQLTMAALVYLQSPSDGMKMADPIIVRMFSPKDQAEQALERRDYEDFRGRVAMEYCLWQLFSQTSDQERAGISDTKLNAEGKEQLLAVYQQMKGKVAAKCKQDYYRLVTMGLVVLVEGE